jgi:hypothetical protein
VEGTVREVLRSLELAAIVSFRLAEAAVVAAEAAVADLVAREAALSAALERSIAAFVQRVAVLADAVAALDTQVGAAVTQWLIEHCLAEAQVSVPDWLRPALVAAVTAAVNATTGGLLSATATTVRSFAGLLRASADALRITAETQQGAAVGLRAVIESLLRGDQLPSVEIPITVEIPNPVLPFVLPGISIEITRVQVPASLVSGVIMTILFDLLGIGPLVRALEDTAASLRATRAAIETVRAALAGGGPARMRAALERSGATGPLRVEILEPRPGALAPVTGEVAFRVTGANWSFVDPRGEGLPGEAISRIRVLLGGRDVPLSSLRWADGGQYMEGRLAYTADPSGTGVLVVPAGPTAAVVLVSDGSGTAAAQASWHFVVDRPADLPTLSLRAWFPIAIDRPFRTPDPLPILVPHREIPLRREVLR